MLDNSFPMIELFEVDVSYWLWTAALSIWFEIWGPWIRAKKILLLLEISSNGYFLVIYT